MQYRYFEVRGSVNDNNLVIFRALKSGKARSFLKTLQSQPNFERLSTSEVITGMNLRTGLVFDKAGAK